MSIKRRENGEGNKNNKKFNEDDLDSLWGNKPLAGNNRIQGKSERTQDQIHLQNGATTTSIEDLLTQAFTLLFRDKFSGFPLLMQRIFNGTVQKNMDTANFLNEMTDPDILKLRNTVFYSARLAMHLAIDKFIMGEVEIPPHEELKVSCR